MGGSNYGALKGKFWCLDKRSHKEGLATSRGGRTWRFNAF